jgi:AraC-like DNA-binding protein
MPDAYPKVYLYRRIVQAKLFIDAYFCEPIDLANISGEASFSKFHFIRLFKKAYGKTPYQYLISVRIEKAKSFLQSGMPVSDACFAVGFESVGSFSSLFRKWVGTNPSVYLAEQQQLKAKMQQAPLEFIPGCFSRQKK